ncbi:UNVERIFIED_CONTAM: hypothetical protein HDU68_011187 [Siphonaria sp. JEL0065]|nr:hypothetical protein HDU68_011187 [Siphonaria sp. JEL0065]
MEALSLFVLKKAIGRFVAFDEKGQQRFNAQVAGGSSSGSIVLRDVALKKESCNDAVAKANLPFSINTAQINELSVRLNSPLLVAKGLVVDLAYAPLPPQPFNQQKQQQQLSSSIHFAREYLSQAADSDTDDDDITTTDSTSESPSLDGAMTLARIIDSILNSAAFSIHDATFKLHISHFVIHITIALVEYKTSIPDPSLAKGKKGTSSVASGGGISGVLQRISNKQLTFKGVSLKIMQLDPMDSLASPVFESSLFVLSDANVENLIKLNVKQDLGLGPEVSTMMGASMMGPTPIWDIDVSFQTMVYSILDVQTLTVIKAILASLVHHNMESESQYYHSEDSATNSSSPMESNANAVQQPSQSFRLQIRIPMFMAFLMYTTDPLSAESIQLLLSQNEQKLVAESRHHLKLEMNSIKFVFAQDAQGALKLSFDTIRLDVAEFITGIPGDFDIPINKYTSLFTISGKAVCKLTERVTMLYKPLEEMTAASPEPMFFRFVSRNSLSPGLFGDRQGEDGVFGMSCLVDVGGKNVEVKLGEVVAVGDVRMLERVLGVLKELLGVHPPVETADIDRSFLLQ